MATDTIDEALAGMDAIIERALADGDRRGYFAVLYRKVTAVVKDGVEAGFFDDAPRMVRLDCRFADRYLDAVAAADRRGTPTASWQLCFDAAPRWRPLVLQHLLVGINAHINLDLGISAAEVAPGDALADLRRDYDRVNAILAAMVAEVQRDLARVSPWLSLLDVVGARNQEQVVRFSIVVARAGAWRFATELAGADAARWDALIAARDDAVTRIGRRVLHPGWWPSSAMLLARSRERGEVRRHLELLRGVTPPSLDAVAAQVDAPTLHPDAAGDRPPDDGRPGR